MTSGNSSHDSSAIEKLNFTDDDHSRPMIGFKNIRTDNNSPILEDATDDDRGTRGDVDKLDLQFTSKLPAITDLVNLRQKTVDPSVNTLIMNLTKYAQNLEHVIRFKNKEIQRLEYINKYLVISQQKRDEMLTHILEENRKLKELSKPDKKQDKKLPAIYSLNSPTQKSMPVLPKPVDDKTLRKTTTLNKKAEVPARTVEKDKTLNPTILLKGKKLLDEKKTQSILKMTEDDVNAMYAENESLIFLERLLMRGTDGFMNEVRAFDDTVLTQHYDSILQLRTDHKALRDLVFKLKKILKAATTMTTSLVISEAMERIVDETCECLDCERATTFLYDITKDQLWSKAAKGSITIRVPANKGIVGHVFMKGEPLNILNAYADDRFNKEFDMRSGFKTNTILAVPIKDQHNKVIGVCQAINKKGHNAYFSKDDEGLLSILSTLAGVVLKNSMTYDEQVSFLNSLRKSLKTGVTLLAEQELKTLIPLSEKLLKSIMGVEQARILLRHPRLHNLYSFNEFEEMVSYPVDSGIIGKVMETCTHLNVTNAYADPFFNGQVDIETSMPVLCIPIRYPNRQKAMGAIQVINSRGIQGLSATHKAKVSGYDLETLEFFATQIGQATLNCYRWERHFCAAKGEPYPFDPASGDNVEDEPNEPDMNIEFTDLEPNEEKKTMFATRKSLGKTKTTIEEKKTEEVKPEQPTQKTPVQGNN